MPWSPAIQQSLLLDTGATCTVVSQQAAGLTTVQLRALQANHANTGSSGDAVPRKVDLQLAEYRWPFRQVFVMNMDATSKRMRTRIEGLLGQDVLWEFSSVRIEYKAGVVEFEQ